MSNRLYPRLAMINVKKHSKLYLPYIISAIITTAMFYVMCEISMNENIGRLPGSGELSTVLAMGDVIIALFSMIFLLYTNSFLMKQRRKEFGLYNVLGMEKKHISRIMFFETLFVSAISIAVGIFGGLLFDKLVSMLLCRLLNFEVKLGFSFSPSAILVTAALFLFIFFVSFVFNVIKIKRSKTIELLYSTNTGEKEPKAKIVFAILGVACLALGYTIALTEKTPLEALMLFFIAVLAVIIGTYLIFMSGSIAVLKLLRKNKNYYYKPKHFNSVSGMIYRMKQNAVGLANICILSTMVLVMVSTTASMYLGLEDALVNAYPKDVRVYLQYSDVDYTFERGSSSKSNEALLKSVKQTIQDCGLAYSNLNDWEYVSFATIKTGDTFNTKGAYDAIEVEMKYSEVHELCVVTAEQYEKYTGKTIELSKNEVLVYSTDEAIGDSFKLFGETYTVKGTLASFPDISDYGKVLKNIHYIVVPDFDTMAAIFRGQKENNENYSSNMSYAISLNLSGTEEQKLECSKAIKQGAKDTLESFPYNIGLSLESRQAGRESFCISYGSFLFLGIVLGSLFLMVTVMIIYYKQISEGYDDRRRFIIMKQVGMSDSEVKKSIRSQILTVFFLPLVTAFVHLAFAFPIISALMLLFNFTNTIAFLIGVLTTAAVFSLIYAIVYALTARTYYKIVS